MAAEIAEQDKPVIEVRRQYLRNPYAGLIHQAGNFDKLAAFLRRRCIHYNQRSAGSGGAENAKIAPPAGVGRGRFQALSR